MSPTLRAAFSLALVNAIFAAHYLVAKEVVAQIDPVALGAIRGLLGGALLAALYPRELREALRPRPSLVWVTLAGLTGFFLNQLLFSIGIRLTTPTHAALISNLIPIASSAIAAAFFGERLTRRRATGLALGFAALAAYFVLQLKVEPMEHVRGNVLVLANVISFAVSLNLSKRALRTVSHEGLTTAVLLIGGVVATALAPGSVVAAARLSAASPALLAFLAFEVVLATAIVYLLQYQALSVLSVAATTVFIYFQVPVTAALSWAIRGDRVNPAIWVVFAGIVLSSWLVVSAPGERRA